MNVSNAILKNMLEQPITAVYLNRCTLRESVVTKTKHETKPYKDNCLVSSTIKNIPSTDALGEKSNFELRNIILPSQVEND